MEFKEWLLNEDPNGIGLGQGDYDYCDYRDADAVAFIVYKGGYIRAPHDSSLIHSKLYELAKSDTFRTGRFDIKVSGNPPEIKLGGSLMDERGIMMTQMVLGRLWTAAYCWADDENKNNRGARRRVISFWNPPAQVLSLKEEIIKMIRELDLTDEYTPGEKTGGLDDPKEYLYEVQGNLMDYDEFFTGHKNKPQPGWNPSKLHTMPPSPEKKMLLGTPALSKGPDLATRLKSYTGD